MDIGFGQLIREEQSGSEYGVRRGLPIPAALTDRVRDRLQKVRAVHPLLVLAALLAGVFAVPAARAADKDFNGRWDIQVNARPGDFAQFTTTAAWWLGITGAGTPAMKIQFVGSPDGSLDDIQTANIRDGVLHFTWTQRTRPGVTPNPNDRADYEVKYVGGHLQGTVTSPSTTPKTRLTFTGYPSPAIDEHDDGAWVKGKPIRLFDGQDLKGWTGVNSPQAEGWSVENGLLKGAGNVDDLITVKKYWNFELHVEYKLPAKSNSGIGLRGRYEVQIASDYGKPPGMHGTGALYTRILPAVNAGKPADEWNTYDIRLVGREVTTVLNGQALYKKGVIDGLTGIAFDPFEGRPGPIELQGDHGGVEFRNIVLVPLTKRNSN